MVEKKLGLKTEFVSFVFIALMLGSIFAGAVSAESISEDISAKTILNGSERYGDFDTSNSLTSSIRRNIVTIANNQVGEHYLWGNGRPNTSSWW